MDPNGDITDAFEDDALAQSIEAGKSGPWNESAEFEDPRLTQVTKDLAVPKPTDYQQRRMKELQKRAARREASGATTAAAPAAPNADVWGEPTTSTWDEEDSPSSEQWQDDSSAFAEPEVTDTPATKPTQRVKGPVARPSTPDAKSTPAATATAPGNARVWLIAVAVIAAAAIGYWLTTAA